MKTTIKRYPFNQCALYKCPSKKKLAYYLKIDLVALNHIEHIIQYNRFQIPKKGTTSMRDITAPCEELKRIQKRILRLLQRIERPEWLISGERGKSYVDNGRAHLNCNYMLTADIKSFYDNCRRDPVYRFFKESLKTAPDVAKILTDLITFEDGIPTGCPTSQLIAYYAYEKMFLEMKAVAERHGCTFTLYVDDMTFSSKVAFDPRNLARDIYFALRRYGHLPKYSKVKYYSRYAEKPVTGTVVTRDHKLVVPNKLRKQILTDYHAIQHATPDQLISCEQKTRLATLNGRIHAARSIDPNLFSGISQQVSVIRSNRTRPHKVTAVDSNQEL